MFKTDDLYVMYVEACFALDAGFKRTVWATEYEHGSELDQVLMVYRVELRDCVPELVR